MLQICRSSHFNSGSAHAAPGYRSTPIAWLSFRWRWGRPLSVADPKRL
jgi:hypothetical protein